MIKKKYFISVAILFIFLSVMTMPTIYAIDSQMPNDVLKLVNAERANNNLSPLHIDSELVSVAEIRTNDIVTLFQHKRPDGSEIPTLSNKIHGENIAYGYSSPQQVMNAWMKSSSHKANILDPNFNSIGIGHLKIANTDYWVQIFSRNKAIESPNVPIKVEKLTISSFSPNKITLKWNSLNIANSHGYQVFTYNSKTKKFSLLKTIHGNVVNSFTNSGLVSLKTYKYKVRSYITINGITYYGPYSSEISVILRPHSPSSFKVFSGKNKANLVWKKVPKAKGYEIFRTTSKNGKYSFKKIIKNSSTTKFTDKNLKKINYYYKVRSYAIVNNKKIYSSFSTIKWVKIK